MSLPNTIALTTIADGSSLTASPVRNNFSDVQTAVNGLISDLDDGAIDGDALIWDATNSKWSAASKLAAGRPRAARVVTSALSGGPPASPVDGDIWIASAVDTDGTRWQFQYNASSSSSYKWEFIGGVPTHVQGNPNAVANTLTQVATTGIWYQPATMSLTVLRAGDYLLRGFSEMNLNGGSSGGFNTWLFTGTTPLQAIPAQVNTAIGNSAAQAIEWPATVTANTVVGVGQAPPAPATNMISTSALFVLPVRVS